MGNYSWAMSSLTLKGKPSEHAPVASMNSETPVAPAASDASSGTRSLIDSQVVISLTLMRKMGCRAVSLKSTDSADVHIDQSP